MRYKPERALKHSTKGCLAARIVTTQAREGIETGSWSARGSRYSVTTQAREGIETDHPESQVIQA